MADASRDTQVFNRLEDILKHLDAKKPESKWIVQKYIDQPALVQGRKFDIRACELGASSQSTWACRDSAVPLILLTSGGRGNVHCGAPAADVLVTPDGSAFMCKEAYVRTSSTPYKLEDLSDK